MRIGGFGSRCLSVWGFGFPGVHSWKTGTLEDRHVSANSGSKQKKKPPAALRFVPLLLLVASKLDHPVPVQNKEKNVFRRRVSVGTERKGRTKGLSAGTDTGLNLEVVALDCIVGGGARGPYFDGTSCRPWLPSPQLGFVGAALRRMASCAARRYSHRRPCPKSGIFVGEWVGEPWPQLVVACGQPLNEPGASVRPISEQKKDPVRSVIIL